jgi:type I restriction enzyme S subunit
MVETPSGWTSTTIGDVVTLQRGHDITRVEQRPGPVPVVSSGGISSWHDQAMAKGPGVVLGRKGTLGRTYYVACDYWPHDTTLWVRDFKGNDPRFVYYFFSNLDFRYLDVGSANPTLNRNHVHPLPTIWPPITEQRGIATVLGALDDKIEVNMKARWTARALAMSIFQDARNRAPERFALSALTTSIARGIAPNYVEERQGVRVINQKCIRDGWVALEAARWMRAPKAAAPRVAHPEDILVNSTGVGTLGRVARWLGHEDVFVDGHVTIVRPDPGKCDPAVLGYAMLASQLELEALGEGSTGQTELSRQRLGGFVLEVPVGVQVSVVAKQLDLLDEFAGGCFEEVRSLSAIRDALLPKLLSGELRIRDAEGLVEERA